MAYKWKPSKTQKKEFAEKMKEIDEFCEKNGIIASSSNDSYYFTINGQNYRVSNHSIESSNRGAYDWTGEQVREKYHEDGRKDDTIYIHAGKTRIIDIYNKLKEGYILDGKGNVKQKPDVTLQDILDEAKKLDDELAEDLKHSKVIWEIEDEEDSEEDEEEL